MKLTKKHIDVANDLALGKLSMQAIANKHGLRNRQTLYDWLAHEEFSGLLDQIEKKYKRMALCIAGRWATEAVKRLVMNTTDKKVDPEIARKSAMDLLNIAGLKVDKVRGEGFESTNTTNIFNAKNFDDFLGDLNNDDVINRVEDIRRRTNGEDQKRLTSTGD